MAYNPYYFSDSDSDSGESQDGQMQIDEEDMGISDFEHPVSMVKIPDSRTHLWRNPTGTGAED